MQGFLEDAIDGLQQLEAGVLHDECCVVLRPIGKVGQDPYRLELHQADLVNCSFTYLHGSGFVVLGGIECEDLGNHVQDGGLHEQLGDREGLLGVFLILRGVREEASDGGQEHQLLD